MVGAIEVLGPLKGMGPFGWQCAPHIWGARQDPGQSTDLAIAVPPLTLRLQKFCLVTIGAEAKNVEAMAVGLEALGLGELVHGLGHAAFEGGAGREVDDLSTATQ